MNRISKGRLSWLLIQIQVNLDMTDHCTTDFCIWQTICLVPVWCISSIRHMYMTDFAYDGPNFLVPLSLSYPCSTVYQTYYLIKYRCVSGSWWNMDILVGLVEIWEEQVEIWVGLVEILSRDNGDFNMNDEDLSRASGDLTRTSGKE